MIPLRDSIKSKSFPLVNIFIIGINIAVFLYEVSLSPERLGFLVDNYGFVPARLTAFLEGQFPVIPLLISSITAIFLHGGWLHLFGNMWFLWVFGDNIEDNLGHRRYLFFYLIVGLAGNLAHGLANPISAVPTVGASGAIAGILGAYLICFPRSRILTFIPLIIFFTIYEIPAVVFLFIWFALQLLSGTAALSMPGETVAWWAHIGGFLAGAILVRVFDKSTKRHALR